MDVVDLTIAMDSSLGQGAGQKSHGNTSFCFLFCENYEWVRLITTLTLEVVHHLIVGRATASPSHCNEYCLCLINPWGSSVLTTDSLSLDLCVLYVWRFSSLSRESKFLQLW
mmetsp:Transcript_8195/g.22731  ORF Transcript_8195/g.22731 Transcript_8195/m.22731 type:complete len:112 (+) Transcript_8195:2137-2472(+)